MINSVTVVKSAGCILAFYVLSRYIERYRRNTSLHNIPTVRYSSSLLSYISAFQLFLNGREIINEGYHRYHGSAFKIAQVNQWHVIVSGPKMIDDIRHARDDQLSLRFAADKATQARYTIGDYRHDLDFYRVGAIRSSVTSAIGPRFSDVRDEIIAAFADEVPAGQNWVKVPVIETARRIVSRTSNRLFVGLPLCRDPDYRDLNVEFTIDVMTSAQILLLFPDFMKPFLARLVTNIPKQMHRAANLLRPFIQDRLDKEKEYGRDWPEKPAGDSDDLLSWLIDNTPAERKSVETIALQVLIINFGAIHTTSIAFTTTFYFLVCHPEFANPIREEIQSIVEENGWTKAAMAQMRKLDSFIKESQRMAGNGATSMNRKVLKDFTFSDGTTVPAGCFISAASWATHNDDNVYPDAHQFKGFRFVDMEANHMVSPTLDYIIFGHGRHSCPGCFFAVNELKAMLAHILMTYDVKFEDERTSPPPPTWFEMSLIPDLTAEVLFRARV
ncbi:cytochrome P450 [Mycena capillaripes]|nr:cytochrome P450 [Mycena capillaripes]